VLPILKDMVYRLLDFKVEKKGMCKGCALGKHIKATFPSSKHRSRESLDSIHLDVCGPMPLASLLGNSYDVTFIDDSFRKSWTLASILGNSYDVSFIDDSFRKS
jgi:hypothetical protein